MPRLLKPGASVWLRHGDRFFHSYVAGEIVQDETRTSTIDGRVLGPGPSLLLVPGSGRRRNLPLAGIADPDGVKASWQRGFRYLSPGAKAFVAATESARALASKVNPRLVPPERRSSEPIEVTTSADARTAERVENGLIIKFQGWSPHSDSLSGYEIPVATGSLRVDLYDTKAGLLIEAKASAKRNHIRLAIGQLFDYKRYLPSSSTLALAVLVPERPSDDLMQLVDGLNIAAIWPVGDGFEDSVGGRAIGTSDR